MIHYLSNKGQISGGYAYGAFYPNKPTGAHILAAHQLTEKVRTDKTKQWFRVEERFLRKLVNEPLTDGYLYTWRFRYPVSE